MQKSSFLILIVEDLAEEIILAKRAVHDVKGLPIVVTNLDDAISFLGRTKDIIFGVITGLHYPKSEEKKEDPDKFYGLDFVKLCIDNGVRVAVCSDSSKNHEVSLKRLAAEPKCRGNKIPFSRKNWDEVLSELLKIK